MNLFLEGPSSTIKKQLIYCEMKIKFSKYQGTGNDFIIIDDREGQFPQKDFELISRLCNRRFGIGGDGLMLLRTKPGYDFEMVYFNSDGHQGSMCGNGGRALVQFAHDLGLVQNDCTFCAVDGDHTAKVKSGLVHLHMIDVHEIESNDKFSFLDTGSPHYVEVIHEDLLAFNVVKEGRNVRYNDRFASVGTNVNFVQVLGDQRLLVRTYERGVEDETLSCGTGVTACALAMNLKHQTPSPITMKVMGGELAVSFERHGQSYTNVHLIGPAQHVFDGEIEL